MAFSDGEAQVLALLAEAEGQKLGAAALTEAGERFRQFQGDFDGALRSLSARAMVEVADGEVRLAPGALPQAFALLTERRDVYYYYFREFYGRVGTSAAYGAYCARAHGRDLTQQGMTDMASLARALAGLALSPGARILDVGCGAGGIAAFIARERGAEVLGIDHAAAAIALAQSQTAEGLRFRQADLNHLGALAAEAPFDAILASDALYWVADMAGTLKALRGLLSTGGRLAILMSHRAEAEADLAPEATRLGLVCAKLGLSHQVEDLTPELAAFWDRAIAAIEDLRPRFAAEGNSFIADWILAEAREGFLPHLARDRMRRYLYVMEA